MRKTVFILIFLFFSVCAWGQAEEEILIGDLLLKYSFSNDIKDIEKAILSRFEISIDSSEITWTENKVLDIKVKNAMDKRNVDYSMTSWIENWYRYIIINRRVGNKWFFVVYQKYIG